MSFLGALLVVVACGPTTPQADAPAAKPKATAGIRTEGAAAEGGGAVEAAPTRGGEAMYLYYCAKCHGQKGLGDGPSVGSLRVQGGLNLTLVGSKSDDELLDTIAGGRGAEMPPWELVLTPDQRREILAHIRTLAK